MSKRVAPVPRAPVSGRPRRRLYPVPGFLCSSLLFALKCPSVGGTGSKVPGGTLVVHDLILRADSIKPCCRPNRLTASIEYSEHVGR
jgi:hypothetical protein